MATEMTYRVTIEVEVTATGYEEAVRYALADLRDPKLDGPWFADVKNMDTGQVMSDVSSAD